MERLPCSARPSLSQTGQRESLSELRGNPPAVLALRLTEQLSRQHMIAIQMDGSMHPFGYGLSDNRVRPILFHDVFEIQIVLGCIVGRHGFDHDTYQKRLSVVTTMAAEADTFTPLHFRELEKCRESQCLGRILERVSHLFCQKFRFEFMIFFDWTFERDGGVSLSLLLVFQYTTRCPTEKELHFSPDFLSIFFCNVSIHALRYSQSFSFDTGVNYGNAETGRR